MNSRNPFDPKDPRAAGDPYSAAKPRRQRRPLGARTANNFGGPSKDQNSADVSPLTAVARFDDESKMTTAECIEYKGYTLNIESHRAGWKAVIFPKGSPFALSRTPYTTEVGGRDGVVEQAKAIVDEATADKTLPKVAIEPAENSKSSSSAQVPFFLRFRRSLSQGWAALKRAYYSVDQPRRTGP